MNITSEIVPFFSYSNCTITISSKNDFNLLFKLRKINSYYEKEKFVIIDKEAIQRSFKNGVQNFTSLSEQFKFIFQTNSLNDSLSFYGEIYLIPKCNDSIAGNRGTINISDYFDKDNYPICSSIIKSEYSKHRILLRYENKDLLKENINYVYSLQDEVEVRSGKNRHFTILTNSNVLKFLYLVNNTR